MRWSWIVLALALPVVSACSNSTPSSASPPSTLTGTWSGDLALQTTPARMTWTLTQSGTSVSGPALVLLSSGTVLMNGTLTGELSGSALTYSITIRAGGIPTQPSCTGQLNGSATLTAGTPPSLPGSYSLASSSCPTPFTSGTFTLVKTGS